MNVICTTNNFGLGPVGKLSSIVNSMPKVNWYGCGEKFDLNIFNKDMLKDCCWTKDTEVIKLFVEKNNIKIAVVVLDASIANILLRLGVKVIFVDSLPFMWTKADAKEGLIPFDVDVYCAQKCIEIPNEAKLVLGKIKNLNWIDPIRPISLKRNNNTGKYVVINLGGMHSPIGNGYGYAECILEPLLRVIVEEGYSDIIITCGTDANKNITMLIQQMNINEKINVKVSTLIQEDFLDLVNNCELFFTSPGLTTMYETCSFDKNTIILPPQNISQFYNIEFAKRLIKNVKTLNWNVKELSFEDLTPIIHKGEEFVVNEIYIRIEDLKQTDYKQKFEENLKKTLKEEYTEANVENMVIFEGNGVETIKNFMEKFND
ncbi:MAG: hypothetical protein FWF46_03075 [Oscillospiraceae bacterium]|nr:hypothetical protein [Oscillospiraceae bacterium]